MSDDGILMRPAKSADDLQPPDVATRAVLGTMAALAAFLAITLGGIWLFYAFKVGQPPAPAPASFPIPQLQTDGGTDELHRLQAAEKEKLDNYGWVDRKHGLIRIPIARAMEDIVARGSNAYEPIERTSGEPAKASP